MSGIKMDNQELARRSAEVSQESSLTREVSLREAMRQAVDYLIGELQVIRDATLEGECCDCESTETTGDICCYKDAANRSKALNKIRGPLGNLLNNATKEIKEDADAQAFLDPESRLIYHGSAAIFHLLNGLYFEQQIHECRNNAEAYGVHVPYYRLKKTMHEERLKYHVAIYSNPDPQTHAQARAELEATVQALDLDNRLEQAKQARDILSCRLKTKKLGIYEQRDDILEFVYPMLHLHGDKGNPFLF